MLMIEVFAVLGEAYCSVTLLVEGEMIAAALCVLLVTATPAPAHLPPCLIIKPYVALYGADAALEWAARHGYTPMQIAEIRKRCAI